jgi:hypothetical protein
VIITIATITTRVSSVTSAAIVGIVLSRRRHHDTEGV